MRKGLPVTAKYRIYIYNNLSFFFTVDSLGGILQIAMHMWIVVIAVLLLLQLLLLLRSCGGRPNDGLIFDIVPTSWETIIHI